MKYAHLADLHLGAWKEDKMRDISAKAFLTAIKDCLNKEVDFILFAGDLFNTSLPSIDTLKIVTRQLKELKEKNIPIYIIAGSHDYSPSGKTMLDVFEQAGLLINVCKGEVNPESKKLHLRFTVDQKTGAKITGLLGRRGMLDRIYYENLYLENLENEAGYKIFMFHTTLTELKPKHLENIESHPLSFLPKRFNYYAGGHVHHPTLLEQPEYGTLTYTGALFPNNFAEIERYGKGGYYLVEAKDGQQSISFIEIEVIKHLPIIINCHHQAPEEINSKILELLKSSDLKDKLITLRLTGKIEQGKISDINFRQIFQSAYDLGAYFVIRNTAQLQSSIFEEIRIGSSFSMEEIENKLIMEHLQQIKIFDRETELELTKALLNTINQSKREGETNIDFQDRIEKEMDLLLKFN